MKNVSGQTHMYMRNGPRMCECTPRMWGPTQKHINEQKNRAQHKNLILALKHAFKHPTKL